MLLHLDMADGASLWLFTNCIYLKRGYSICAGVHYAETMFFISMARILSTFDVTKAKDKHGAEITPEIKFNSSIVRYVKQRAVTFPETEFALTLSRETLNFECAINPRSETAKSLVMAGISSL